MSITLPEIFILSGAVYSLFIGAKYSLRIHASRSWPSVTGKIICSEVEGRWENESTGRGWNFSYMYKPVIRYEYFIDGLRLEGDEISYKSFSCNIESFVADPKKKFPLGQAVEVFYNPKKPADSLLATARAPIWIQALPFLISIALLVLFLSGAVKNWKS